MLALCALIQGKRRICLEWKAVVTGKDFPHRMGLYLKDRTPYAIDKVRYFGEPVAGVAAESPEIAEEALKLIGVEYEGASSCA